MEVIELVLHAPSRYVSYAFLTDTHIGVVNCDEEYLSRTIATIADDPTCWWFFGGDACLSEDTEILTERGWCTLDTIQRTDSVVVYHPQTGALAHEQIQRLVIRPPILGQTMIHCQSGLVDLLVTEDHRMLIQHQYLCKKRKETEVVRADSLLKNKTKWLYQVPVAGDWHCYFGKKRTTWSLLQTVERVPYGGRTWCVTTDTGFIVVRRNNQPAIVGNCEFINYSDRRFDSRTAAEWLKVKDLGNLANVQLDYFMQLVDPIRGKCLGGHPGNHEDLIYRKYHLDIMDRLCRELPMRNLGCVAQIRLRLERDGQSPLYYDIYSTHGCSGKLAGWANKVRAGFDADIYQRGHLHSEKQWFVAPHLGMRRSGNPHTLQRMQLFLTGGSYYRTYMKGIISYGERREYPPAALGSLKVTFDTETGKFWCSEVC